MRVARFYSRVQSYRTYQYKICSFQLNRVSECSPPKSNGHRPRIFHHRTARAHSNGQQSCVHMQPLPAVPPRELLLPRNREPDLVSPEWLEERALAGTPADVGRTVVVAEDLVSRDGLEPVEPDERVRVEGAVPVAPAAHTRCRVGHHPGCVRAHGLWSVLAPQEGGLMRTQESFLMCVPWLTMVSKDGGHVQKLVKGGGGTYAMPTFLACTSTEAPQISCSAPEGLQMRPSGRALPRIS
jgi:hypothetical protein